ncbi:MAG: D-alanyl-D-alanine carboxypeptidase [Acidobacteriota bacterium]|nr:D-alanyl-D-alanine carboxypeptidase [Acidobacteriota bacterium]
MKKRCGILACLIFAIPHFSLASASALDPTNVAGIFERLTAGSALANPSVVVMDQLTGAVVYEKNANSLRKPASVLKLYSATAALTYLQPTQRFTTSTWIGLEPKSLVIQGSLDPWMSLSDPVAKKMGRTSIPRIEYNSLSALKESNSGSIRNSTIYYSDLYSQDVANIKAFFVKHGVRAVMKEVSSTQAIQLSSEPILSSQSPELQEMLAFALTWSDNVLTERIARLAAHAAGHPLNDEGVARTFNEVLAGLGVENKGIVIKDASGLSRDNRVSATQVGQLLLKIRSDSRFAPLIGGLPIGGVTGTLRHRFIDTAPQAIGLVRAKTGTLNGTANLAGYVEAGDREYVFVIIADQLKRTSRAEKFARATVDRILGKIASPLLPVFPTTAAEVSTEVVATTA